MNTMLIDSSAWIEYFKGDKNFLFINDFIENNAICTNDLILMELLPSMAHKKENALIELMNHVHKIDIHINWQALQQYQMLNLQHGNNHVPIADLILAQNCIENNVTLVTQDKHFSLMEKYLPLKLFKHGVAS